MARSPRRTLDVLDAASGPRARSARPSRRADALGAVLDAWRRALQVRVTQDWRAIALTPATTAIEELEYLRARRQTVVRQRGIS